MKGHISSSVDPTTCGTSPESGVNFTENQGIKPGANTPKGESAVNTSKPEPSESKMYTKKYPTV